MIFAVTDTQKAYCDTPFAIPPAEKLSRLQTAQIETNKGSIFIELYPEDAPIHVANFKYRADKGLFRNTSFNKFTSGYVIQGGSPSPKLKAKKYSLPPEFNTHPHQRGSIGMARVEDIINPERNSDASQFYILLMDNPTMDGKYTTFGKVIKGFDVMDRLRKGDTIKDVRVFVR